MLAAPSCRRTPSPKTSSRTLIDRFLDGNPSALSVHPRSLAAKDEIFCIFAGMLENLGRLRQQYGLAKNANEVTLVIEAYKVLRDRAPYPPNHVVGHLVGDFVFMVFDAAANTLTNLVRFHCIGASQLMDMLRFCTHRVAPWSVRCTDLNLISFGSESVFERDS